MAIFRINYFSKRKKEDDEISDKQLGVLAGAGLGYVGSVSAGKLLLEKFKRSSNGSKELRGKLIKEAKDLGVEVKSNPGFNNSVYTGNGAFRRKIGEIYKQNKKYKRLPDSMKQLIDDLGKERPSGWTLEKLFTIINNRYENNLPIIITTNYNKEKLRKRLLCNNNEEIVDSIISRLYEMCRGIIIFGKDKRKELV